MKILFMGTPDFARTILQAIRESGEEIVGVVTQPDKPKGRKMILSPSPVKEYALTQNLPVYQPTTLKDGAFADTLQDLQPELILVAAYGKLLPEYILTFPKYGCINAHASLLPRYRGAAPIQRAILSGDTVTGVTAMYMAAGMDTGDMILKEEVSITPDDDFGTLHDKLADAGCRAMLQTIAQCKNGTICRTPQCDADATYAAKIENADCVLDFSCSVTKIHNRIRALSPFPLAVTRMPNGKLLKILAATPEITPVSSCPGTVLDVRHGTLDVACADGILHIHTVQPEGKKRMDAAAFLNGRGISVHEILQTPTL